MKVLILFIGIFLMFTQSVFSAEVDVNPHEGYAYLFKAIDEALKNTVKEYFDVFTKIVTKFLNSFMILYLIIMGGKTLALGQKLFSNVVSKAILFVFLSSLLSYGNFSKYVFDIAESLYINMPTLVTVGANNMSNIFDNLITQIFKLQVAIWDEAFKGWLMTADIIYAFLAIICLFILGVVVLIMALIIEVRFYLVMSLSSIWILCFFFQFSRSWGIGAIKSIVGSILTMTLLCAFLSMYSEVIMNTFTGEQTFNPAGYLLTCGFSLVGIFLISQVGSIAQELVGTAISTGTGIGKMVEKAISKGIM